MAELKKIAFFITDLDFGGAEQVLFDLCQGLKEKFHICVFTLKGKGHFARMIEELGIPVKSYELKSAKGLLYFSRFIYILFRAILDLRKFQPDIIQGILFQGNFVARIAGKLSGNKIILCSLHTFDRGRIKFLIEKFSSWMVYKYIVVSDALKGFCIKEFCIPDEKIIVIRNGIKITRGNSDLKEIRDKLGMSPESTIIGTISRLHSEKGIDILLRAFKHLAKDFPDSELVIIGDGPERARLLASAEKLDIKHRTHFTGFLPEPEKYLLVFDLFVLPSRIEAMPVALMQAMANGKAIVATKVGGIPELLEDNQQGLLVPAEDEFMLTRAISRLLHDPELAKRLGENARAKAEQEFGLEKMIADYKKLYLDLMGEKS